MSYQELTSLAMQRFNSGAFEEATSLTNQLVELEPGNLTGYMLQGAILAAQEKFSDAIPVFERMLSYQSGRQNYDVNHNLAMCYLRTGQFGKALERCAHAIQLKPDNVTDRVDLALAFSGMGDHAKALAGIELSRRAFPGKVSPVNTFHAMALALNGELDRAIQVYRPWWQQKLHGAQSRRAWYNTDNLSKADDIAVQSGRIGYGYDSIEREFWHITRTLNLSDQDTVLDVGGAGGLFAMKIAPLVKSVTLSDVSVALVERAADRVGIRKNISFLVADITKEKPVESFDKILMASVTPYFSNLQALEGALKNIHGCLLPGGLCLVSNNFDVGSAERYAAHILRHANEDSVADLMQKTDMFEEMFWIDVEKLKHMVARVGFASMQIINPRVTATEQTMFDFLLQK